MQDRYMQDRYMQDRYMQDRYNKGLTVLNHCTSVALGLSFRTIDRGY